MKINIKLFRSIWRLSLVLMVLLPTTGGALAARAADVTASGIPAGLSGAERGQIEALLPPAAEVVPAIQQAYLKASNAGAVDYFSSSVALDGDTMVVGAWGEDSDGTSQSDNSAYRAGAAYVFVRSGGIWSQQAYLKASNAEWGDTSALRWRSAGIR